MCTGSHPYIPVINVAKMELQYMLDGQKVENIFHLHNVASWNATGLAFAANVMKTWAIGAYAACQNEALTLVNIKATDLSSVSGTVIELPVDPAHAGAVTSSAPLPNNITLVIKWLTTQRGRSFRGRTYVPGISSGQVVKNTAQASLVTLVSTAASTLFSAVAVQNYSLCVVSYCNDKAWRTTGVQTPITAWSVDTTVDTQRRRLPGRGR